MTDQDGEKPKSKKHITPKIMLGVIFIFLIIVLYEGLNNLERFENIDERSPRLMFMRMPF